MADHPAETVPDGRTALGRKRRADTRVRILAAAFEIFGDENGLFARIEDVADMAGVTRATFYNHFTGMAELREALTQGVTHDFLLSVTRTVDRLPDARERCTAATRFYLHRAQEDARWGWSMVNISASGLIFGAETYRAAEATVREGIECGALPILSPELGRDILLGSALAAVNSILRGEAPKDYPEAVAGYILFALGVPFEAAKTIAHLPLPPLIMDPI
ncbi:TetR family transcriptional regulator [Altererythrobacter xixiisoli]|uniref:TetR family transcriptional regulator n=1 Tax=Croceibacterium xixiisoli TaxID=1476466 RepID=A0A6I4TVV5_9SPHN|nr:TetR/AcrR family transcriptional regulator [Croceibacterium xixiisoli]MXO98728.1 TetR family transcriptional regulator [Croceibacterium xixiisoli]